VVAIKTRDVASATNAEIVADWRPVLLVEGFRRDDGSWYEGIHGTREVFSIYFTNAGRGPALDVIACLDREEEYLQENPQRMSNGMAPKSRGLAAWSSATGPELLWDANRQETGHVTYGDLGGNGYRTRFVVNVEHPRGAWLEWQGVEELVDYEPPTVLARQDVHAA
jgi:hypothetical protein